MTENQQPIYKRWWFIAFIIFAVLWLSNKYSTPSAGISSSNNSASSQSEYVSCPHCDGTGKRMNEVTGVYGVCGTCNGTGQVKQGNGYKWVKSH